MKFKFLKSELNDVAGGNIDLRGSLGVSLFKSDISAFYAQQVEGMELENYEVKGEELEVDYFKQGIYHQF